MEPETAIGGFERILSARQEKPFSSLSDFRSRVKPGRRVTENLIRSGAMDIWGIPRRQLLWELGQPQVEDGLDLVFLNDEVDLPALSPVEAMLGS